jgi:hypothetical protein
VTKDVVKAYKIRDRETGLFSTGGMDPRWSKTGKTWSTEGQLKSHLRLVTQWKSGYGKTEWRVPESWEVISLVYTLSLQDTCTYSARDLAERPAKR